jgi:rod shape-determining protein MreD
MRGAAVGRREWSAVRFVPTLATLVLAMLSVLPLRFPIYRPDLLPPTAVFLCGFVLDLLSGGPLGVSPLVFLLARVVVLLQRRFFVDRLFPFVWGGFTLLAAGAIAFLWVLGSMLTGFMLDMRAASLQWVLTVACFPAVAYLLMRVQRAFVPSF